MPTYLLKTTLISSPLEGRKPIVVERLVDAKNVAQAIRHVAKDTITCEVAGAQDCVRLGKAGVDVETASAE